MISRLPILLIACPLLALAEDPAQPAPKPAADPATDSATSEPAKPKVEKLSDTRFRIGEVTFDQKNREISFPAKVNMNKGLLEYLIVLQKGKVHEALIVTEISPTFLNLAFTLLRYPPSIELFSLMEDGHMTGLYPNVPAAVKAGARILIEVEWDDKGTTRRAQINDWIKHSVKDTAMPPGPWLYTGGDVFDGKYVPEITGDIAAITTAPAAVINYPGGDNDNNVWVAFPDRIPAPGTSLKVIITSNSGPKTSPKPITKP